PKSGRSCGGPPFRRCLLRWGGKRSRGLRIAWILAREEAARERPIGNRRARPARPGEAHAGMSEIAELFYPAIRWEESRGYEGQRAAIEEALKLGVGGFILFGGPSEHVAALTEDLHSKSRNALLIGSDLERGAGQQFAGQTALPPLAAIASLEDVQAIRRAAAVTAREARELGINWIYAPDCDLDIEPSNPIIGTRSFGSDPERVGEYAAAWIDACQAEGVLASAKHFPGHGRTTVDSHKELPRVEVSKEVLLETDLVPFRRAIERGVASVMSAHVAFPALDPSGMP